ncbi:MAG: collagen-like protein [Acidimicrobiales bacterium]
MAVEGAVLFDSNGPLSGFTHTAGSASITVGSTGTYLVDFSISGTEPNQFSLFDNASPVAGTTYSSVAGTQQDGGQAVVSLAAGDVVTLVNHSSSAAVGLASDIGGTQTNVNASIVIEELG